MGERKLNLIVVTDGIFPHSIGGIQRYSRLLIEELATRESLNITVIHPHEGTQVFDSALNITEITVADISTKKNYLRECYDYSKRTYEVIQKGNYDLIYAQGISVWHKIKELTPQLINNPHGLETFQAITLKDKIKGIPFRITQRKIFKNSKYVASEGGKLTEILHTILPKEKVIFIPNAVNIPEHAGLKDKPGKDEPVQFFFIARFAHNKGIHLLMQAIEELNEEGYADKLSFKLGGKGPLFEGYKERYKFDNVDMLGFVSDEELLNLYATSDAFVFPTLFEGMPTVLLEAMSNYLPIIVADTGATRELVDDTNGWLIGKNSVSQLKTAIVAYYNSSKEKKNALSTASFERVRDGFTWQKVTDRHMDLFDKVLSK